MERKRKKLPSREPPKGIDGTGDKPPQQQNKPSGSRGQPQDLLVVTYQLLILRLFLQRSLVDVFFLGKEDDLVKMFKKKFTKLDLGTMQDIIYKAYATLRSRTKVIDKIDGYFWIVAFNLTLKELEQPVLCNLEENVLHYNKVNLEEEDSLRISRERSRLAQDCLNMLDVPDRIIMEKWSHDYSYAEIAEYTELKISTVRGIISRSKKKLRKHFNR